jgi:hypothetical protein
LLGSAGAAAMYAQAILLQRKHAANSVSYTTPMAQA